MILIGVQCLILLVSVVQFVVVGLDLEVGLDVVVWFFAFGIVLSCVLGYGGCGSCVVVAVSWWWLVVTVVVGWPRCKHQNFMMYSQSFDCS